MRDLLFDFFGDENQLDIVLNNSEIQTDESLKIPVFISLFTDARCEENEVPKGQYSRRGFWGDAIFGEKQVQNYGYWKELNITTKLL